MHSINIFVASSIEELHTERTAIGAIESRINVNLETTGHRVHFFFCEDYDSAYNGRRKQDEYNEVIPSCEYFFVMFGTKMGDKTIEELKVAIASQEQSGFPKIIVFLKKNDTVNNSAVIQKNLWFLPNDTPVYEFTSIPELKSEIKTILSNI